MFPISSLIGRLRSKIDDVLPGKDILSEDGTQYVVPLSKNPIVSGSDLVYISHPTFTTGLNQFVPLNGFQPNGAYLSGNNLTYTINYTYGELSFYQGSGTVIASTGLVPFAPWNTSTVTAYYQYTKYPDYIMANYLSYAVASVESSLQIGMYISGVSGIVPPQLTNRSLNDNVNYQTIDPYAAGEVFVIAEPVEILQELIAKRASYDLLSRERRIGAGNAIKIVDGDTQIDTSVNQRYFADYIKDVKIDLDSTTRFIMQNMLDGFSLKQIDEKAAIWGVSARTYINGGLATPVDY